MFAIIPLLFFAGTKTTYEAEYIVIRKTPKLIFASEQIEKNIAISTPKEVDLSVEEDISCNCYLTIKSRGYDLPAMKDILPNSVPIIGSIAIFDYDGVRHVAEVVSLSSDTFQVFEGNYRKCEQGYRDVNWDDKAIEGFYTLNND